MSTWFTDLAGRAEELLNKVDKSAAVALKKEGDAVDKQAHFVGRSRSTTPPVRNTAMVPLMFVSQSQPHTSGGSLTTTSGSMSSSVSTHSSSIVESVSSSSKLKSKQQIEEEKLFAFLNSSDGTETRHIKKSPSLTQVTDTNQVTAVALSIEDAKELAAKVQISSLASDTDEQKYPSVTATIETLPHDVVEIVQDQSTSKVGSLDVENRLLHNEIASLNRELKQSLQKTQNLEVELRQVQKRLDDYSTRIDNETKIVRECSERESDLRSALEAKVSQLAVLRVRLDEADRELIGKREAFDKLEAENQRILEDHSNSSGFHGQTIQAAQDRLMQTEELLERERVYFRSLQTESTQKISRLEEEVHTLTSNFGTTKSNFEEERSRNAELSAQLKTVKLSLESAQLELTDYKTKAQRILQSKERLIASLKESVSGSSIGAINDEGENVSAGTVHLEAIRQERDLLKEDLLESNRLIEQLRAEIKDVESQMQTELDASREYSRETEERLKEERRRCETDEQEYAQLRDEVRYLREDGARQKAILQSRLVDRDAEIERLRKQLVIRQVNGVGSSTGSNSNHAELEAKLNALTESLIQKQTVVEALSTEKNSLVFQLERAEKQLTDQSLHSRRNPSMAVNVNDDCDVKLRMAGFMAETPFDGQVTRKMKHVYNTIDKFSFRFGVFLRRYPMARVLIILYMVLLHFWVLVVLLTYSPEIHDKDCTIPSGK